MALHQIVDCLLTICLHFRLLIAACVAPCQCYIAAPQQNLSTPKRRPELCTTAHRKLKLVQRNSIGNHYESVHVSLGPVCLVAFPMLKILLFSSIFAGPLASTVLDPSISSSVRLAFPSCLLSFVPSFHEPRTFNASSRAWLP